MKSLSKYIAPFRKINCNNDKNDLCLQEKLPFKFIYYVKALYVIHDHELFSSKSRIQTINLNITIHFNRL